MAGENASAPERTRVVRAQRLSRNLPTGKSSPAARTASGKQTVPSRAVFQAAQTRESSTCLKSLVEPGPHRRDILEQANSKPNHPNRSATRNSALPASKSVSESPTTGGDKGGRNRCATCSNSTNTLPFAATATVTLIHDYNPPYSSPMKNRKAINSSSRRSRTANSRSSQARAAREVPPQSPGRLPNTRLVMVRLKPPGSKTWLMLGSENSPIRIKTTSPASGPLSKFLSKTLDKHP